jgi:hypothetical protein
MGGQDGLQSSGRAGRRANGALMGIQTNCRTGLGEDGLAKGLASGGFVRGSTV